MYFYIFIWYTRFKIVELLKCTFLKIKYVEVIENLLSIFNTLSIIYSKNLFTFYLNIIFFFKWVFVEFVSNQLEICTRCLLK